MATHRTVVEDGCRIFDLEAEVERYAEENLKLKKQVIELTDKEEGERELQSKYGRLKEEYECAERRWKEEKKGLTDKCWEFEMVAKRLRLEVDIMALRLKAAEAEAGQVESLMEEKQATVSALLCKIQALEKVEVDLWRKIEGLGEEMEMEMERRNVLIRDLKKGLEIACMVNRNREAENRRLEEERVLELMREIEVLESNKGDRDDEICELKRNLEDVGMNGSDILDYIRDLEKAKEELDCNRKKFEGILNEKNAMENKCRERIEVLEREKKELETKFDGMENECRERIEVLERVKKELETKFDRMEKEKDEEILKNSIEKMDLEAAKDVYAKTNFALVDRITLLETEKRVFEADITEKQIVIRELEEAIVKLASTCTPQQNEGQNVNLLKRKRFSRQTNGNTESEVSVACEWEAEQELLEAFDSNPELCLKAVCAIYRQHTRLPDSTDSSPQHSTDSNPELSFRERGFRPEHSDQAVALAQYLISEDPEGRKMKKLVARLDKFNPLAVDVCKSIAKQHYKQVFEIYKKKEDPLFLP